MTLEGQADQGSSYPGVPLIEKKALRVSVEPEVQPLGAFGKDSSTRSILHQVHSRECVQYASKGTSQGLYSTFLEKGVTRDQKSGVHTWTNVGITRGDNKKRCEVYNNTRVQGCLNFTKRGKGESLAQKMLHFVGEIIFFFFSSLNRGQVIKASEINKKAPKNKRRGERVY